MVRLKVLRISLPFLKRSGVVGITPYSASCCMWTAALSSPSSRWSLLKAQNLAMNKAVLGHHAGVIWRLKYLKVPYKKDLESFLFRTTLGSERAEGLALTLTSPTATSVNHPVIRLITPVTSMMYLNPSAHSWKSRYAIEPSVLKFHETLPNYDKTPLLRLPAKLSEQLGVGTILLKDESHRFGLPAYKILGASWGCMRTITQSLGVPATTSLSAVKSFTAGNKYTFCTATDGNWGRAVARMTKTLGANAHIYVPKVMVEATKQKIRLEGAEVVVVDGDYDVAVKEAEKGATARPDGLLIEDTAWPGYEEIPQWVVDGYSTMMVEIDEQCQELTGRPPKMIICPVGVGSLAQAVVAHYKSRNLPSTVLTVEPDTAACLKTSLENGKMKSIPTGNTTMCGMNCGTVSMTAWPFLRDGVDASITVTDDESAKAQQMLEDMGMSMGPCSAATLAALLSISEKEKEKLHLNRDAVIVLLGTEGPRGEDSDKS